MFLSLIDRLSSAALQTLRLLTTDKLRARANWLALDDDVERLLMKTNGI